MTKDTEHDPWLRVCDNCRGAEFGWVTTEGSLFSGRCPVCEKEGQLYTFRAGYVRNFQQRIAELEKELQAIHERDKTMYDFRAHKEYIEKEVEAAELRGEKRGFEAAIKQVWDWARLGSAEDTLIRSGDILLKLDRMARDYKKSLKG